MCRGLKVSGHFVFKTSSNGENGLAPKLNL